MKTAQSKPFMYNNFQLYWVKEERREIEQTKDLKRERGRSWKRFSQTSDTEESNSQKEEQEFKLNTNKRRGEWNRSIENQAAASRSSIQDRNTKNKTRYTNLLEEEEEPYRRETAELKTQTQEEAIHTNDILNRILERLERLEEARSTTWNSLAYRS
jgi:hypothetical protein